jgi:hypothetical protein
MTGVLRALGGETVGGGDGAAGFGAVVAAGMGIAGGGGGFWLSQTPTPITAAPLVRRRTAAPVTR